MKLQPEKRTIKFEFWFFVHFNCHLFPLLTFPFYFASGVKVFTEKPFSFAKLRCTILLLMMNTDEWSKQSQKRVKLHRVNGILTIHTIDRKFPFWFRTIQSYSEKCPVLAFCVKLTFSRWEKFLIDGMRVELCSFNRIVFQVIGQ